jgi:UrcA family protein
MKCNVKKTTVGQLVLALLGTAFVSGPAFAEATDEVIVESTPSTTSRHPLFTGASAEAVSITQRVSYADLDLASRAGVEALEARVHSTAESICEKLGKMYLEPGFDEFACVRNAVRGGMAKAKTAVALAERRTRTAGLLTER